MSSNQPQRTRTHKKLTANPNPRAIDTPDTGDATDSVNDANAYDQKPAADAKKPPSSHDDVQRQVALYLFDVIDFIQEDMIRSRDSRKEQSSVLSYFWTEFSKYAPIKRGRMFVRSKLVQVLLDACSEPATSRELGIPSLIRWPATEWYGFIDLLQETRTACLHYDGTSIDWDRSNGNKEKDIEEDEANSRAPDYAMHDCFHQKYETIMRLCKLQAALAPIRYKLEKQIQSTDLENEKPTVHPKRVEQLLKYTLQESDPIVQNWLTWLFEHESNKKNNDSGVQIRPILKTCGELKVILKESPFNLDWIQERIEHIIQTWNFTCFGNTESALYKINYTKFSAEQAATSRSAKNLVTQTTQERQYSDAPLTSIAASTTELDMELNATPSQKNTHGVSIAEGRDHRTLAQRNSDIEVLQRFRDQLGNNHGDDPREEARRLAAQAIQHMNPPPTATKRDQSFEHDTSPTKKKSHGRSFYEVKKSQTSLQFSDSEDEVDSPGSDSVAQRKRLKFAPPDEGRFDATGRVLVKIKFTEEEDAALKAGIVQFGVGKWAKIKSAFAYELRNRTSVMIKDRYRNLLKQGRVDPDPPESAGENDNKENES